MKTKRAKGGGRRAKGPFSGTSAVVTARITPELRKWLDLDRKKKNWSLSQVLEARLREAYAHDHKTSHSPVHIEALLRLVARLVDTVEVSTGLKWHSDRFTFEVLEIALTSLLARLGPTAERDVPKLLQDQQSTRDVRFPSLTEPGTTGHAIGDGLYYQLMVDNSPEIVGGPFRIKKAEGFAAIRRTLGIAEDET